MKLAIPFRERLSGFLQVVADELDNDYGVIQTWSAAEHNDDGTHQAKMISQIAAQESGGTHERSNHTDDMNPLVFTPDCGPSHRDKTST